MDQPGINSMTANCDLNIKTIHTGTMAKPGDYVQVGTRRGIVLSVLQRKTGPVIVISTQGQDGQRDQLILPRDEAQVIMTRREVRKAHFKGWHEE